LQIEIKNSALKNIRYINISRQKMWHKGTHTLSVLKAGFGRELRNQNRYLQPG